MSDLDVRIVELGPMRVASAYGFGPQPEGVAARKMVDFLKTKGLLDDYGTSHRHFGFNNPNPSAGSPNYGYEIWVDVPETVTPDGDVRIIHFEGGLYAVTRFEDLDNIGGVWHKLVMWRENSAYKRANHQWLENLLNPLEDDIHKFVFELYLPVTE